MHRAIISGLLATSMLVSTVAQAVPLTAPQYTITEIQTKLDSGEFYNYPGVVREGINGVRVGPVSNNYLFGKTFEIGQALPEIRDIVALQRAMKSEAKTVLVASNDWILPVPAVFVELGRQNGVDGATFMEHYVISTTDINAEGFAEYAKAQTQAVIDTLGITSVTIDTKKLVDAGVLDELQAEKLAHSLTKDALEDAQDMVESLTEEKRVLLAEAITLNDRIDTLERQVEAFDVTANDLAVREAGRQVGLTEAKQAIIDRARSEFGLALTVTAEDHSLQISRQIGRLSIQKAKQAVIDVYDLPASITKTSSARDIAIAVYAAGRSSVTFVNSDFQTVLDTIDIDSISIDSKLNQAIMNGDRGTPAPGALQSGEAGIDLATANGYIDVYGTQNVVLVENGITTDYVYNGLTAAQAGAYGTQIGSTTTISYSEGGYVSDDVESGFVTLSEDAAGTLSYSIVEQEITEVVHDAINAAISDAYNAGYADGYADGYRDGFEDGFAAGQATN